MEFIVHVLNLVTQPFSLDYHQSHHKFDSQTSTVNFNLRLFVAASDDAVRILQMHCFLVSLLLII